MRILLSIKPEYSSRILSGQKTYEFRKREFQCDFPVEVIIYESSPTMMVVGSFVAKSQIIDTPENLWRKTKKTAGISKQAYFEYFDGRDIAVALEIVSFKIFNKQKTLLSLSGSNKPPQSYQYLI